ncbi:MAG: trypsin-like peptidase domain-containing protein [Firmicutes bacterium]|nr:trypsin-like peptidase domain-containing protein [Bacillota bacterium]
MDEYKNDNDIMNEEDKRTAEVLKEETADTEAVTDETLTDEAVTEETVTNGTVSDETLTAEAVQGIGEQAEQDKAAAELRQKRAAFRKTAALGLTGAVLFGIALGSSLGVAYNSSRNLFVKSAQPFNFETENKENEAVSAEAVNITPANNDVIDTINKVKNSVVNISTTETQSGFFNQIYESQGAGSGIIYSQDDEKVYIVTNNHVVEDATDVSISITGSETVKASLVGRDPSSDIAVIYVLKTDLKAAGINEVTPAVFGDSDKVQAGEYVVAIGNALGEGKTTTRGIISAENKVINIDGKKLSMIQTDAAINPGNSGGALVNSAGQVIGINTAKYSSYSVEGTGFAIPVNTANDVITQLMDKGSVDKPYIGIVGYTIDEDFKKMYSIETDGVLVQSIEMGSPAEKAGIQRTDIITSIDGVNVATIEQLQAEIKKHSSGDTITLGIVRDGYRQTEVKVTLENYNEQF